MLVCATAIAGDDAGSSETVLSREMCSGLFLMPLVWTSKDSGRRHELMGVFDTGGSHAFIDPDSLERASGTRVETGTRVRMQNVSAAGTAFSTFRPLVRDMDHLGRALGRQLDVFVPFEAFDDCLLTLDYPRGELRISRGTLPEPDGVEVFSSRGRDTRPWLDVRVGSRTRSLLIDSGSNGTIAVHARDDLRWQTPPLPLAVTHGMNDVELIGVGRLAGSVVVGAQTFDDPIVSLTTDTELLGWEVLRHFVLTFDQQHARVRLRRVEEGPVRLKARRGTGAVLRAREEGFEVAHVLEGSPAERAGIERGDLVTRVDGVPVFERGCPEEHPREAESLRFTIRRGERTLEMTVPVVVLVP